MSARPTVTMRISSTYEDGHESTVTAVVPAPEGDLESWWEDVIEPHTGDGHGAKHPCLGYCYTATVLTAPNASLVGAQREWVGR